MTVYRRYHDPQDAQPLGRCEGCGRELYEQTPAGLCARCGEREEQKMSMKALAEEYRQSAELLGTRIDALCAERLRLSGAPLERMNRRLTELCRMYSRTLQTARELDRYER